MKFFWTRTPKRLKAAYKCYQDRSEELILSYLLNDEVFICLKSYLDEGGYPKTNKRYSKVSFYRWSKPDRKLQATLESKEDISIQEEGFKIIYITQDFLKRLWNDLPGYEDIKYINYKFLGDVIEENG